MGAPKPTNNLSPNLEIQLIDKSLGSTPLPLGAAGFLLPAVWGPINKVMTITSVDNLKKLYGLPVYPYTHISWTVIKEYLGYGAGAAKVCRIGKDDYTTKNACKVIQAEFSGEHVVRDESTYPVMYNGTNQFRKLNMEDESYDSIRVTKIQLDDDPSSAWSVGDEITNSADPTIKGKLIAILEKADTTATTAYAFLTDVEGTFLSGQTLTNGTGTANVVSVEEKVSYDFNFLTKYLSFSAVHHNKIPVGVTIKQNGTSALVIGKDSDKVYLATDQSFSGGDITDIDGISIEPGKVTVISETKFEDVLQIYAKYSGPFGNDISVGICNSTGFSANETYAPDKSYKNEFDVTSIESKDLAVVVLVAGELKEKFIVSVDQNATLPGGIPKFIENYINTYSNYIGVNAKQTGSVTVESLANSVTITHMEIKLQNGDIKFWELPEVLKGYDELYKKQSGCRWIADFHDLQDMSLFADVLNYCSLKNQVSKRIQFVCTLKKDSIKPDSFDVTTAISDIKSINDFFFIPYYEWKQVYSTELKKNIWIPLTGDHIANMILSIQNFSDIEAPAGIQRGVLRNVKALYYNLEEGNGSPVSELYKYGVNADVYREDDAGNTLYCMWGNRTKYNPQSDLSRINVVNGLITDTLKLANLVTPYIFALIDENTYTSIENTCDRGYLARRADEAYDKLDGDNGYVFICDTSNNDAGARKEKTIYMDFMVKYKGAAEYLKLRITIVAAGMDFALI